MCNTPSRALFAKYFPNYSLPSITSQPYRSRECYYLFSVIIYSTSRRRDKNRKEKESVQRYTVVSCISVATRHGSQATRVLRHDCVDVVGDRTLALSEIGLSVITKCRYHRCHYFLFRHAGKSEAWTLSWIFRYLKMKTEKKSTKNVSTGDDKTHPCLRPCVRIYSKMNIQSTNPV